MLGVCVCLRDAGDDVRANGLWGRPRAPSCRKGRSCSAEELEAPVKCPSPWALAPAATRDTADVATAATWENTAEAAAAPRDTIDEKWSEI